MKTYQEYCEAIRQRESSGNYGCKNAYGFLGAYQFGTARLCDLGLCIRRDTNSQSMDNRAFVFAGSLTEEKFLADKELQDKTFDRHILGLKIQIYRLAQKHGFNPEGDHKGREFTISGSIAAAHLTGPQSLVDLLTGKMSTIKDAFGTETTEYLFKFSGYDIP
jgi:hypothetical protein